MGRIGKPYVPFVQAKLVGKKQRPTLIALESSFTTEAAGAAYAIAMTTHGETSKWSIHYVVDETQTINCVDPSKQAQFYDDNRRMIGIKLCDDPSLPDSRWENRSHSMLLSRLADLTAQLCLLYGIKPRVISGSEYLKWTKWRSKRRGGIFVHGNMVKGYWPEDYFITLVKANMEKHKFVIAK